MRRRPRFRYYGSITWTVILAKPYERSPPVEAVAIGCGDRFETIGGQQRSSSRQRHDCSRMSGATFAAKRLKNPC
jgi:hypothetical protein